MGGPGRGIKAPMQDWFKRRFPLFLKKVRLN